METTPLALALFDFVPVILFLVGAFFLVRIAVLLSGTACSRMVAAGSVLIFLGGFLKAAWKLMVAASMGDILWMSQIQFILVAPGFVALLAAVILIARGRKKKGAVRRSTPLLAIAAWKIPLLAVMTLASMGAQGILAYLAFRRGARLAAAGFIVAFLCLVGMGAMASGEQSLAKQWLEEIINAVGELGFALGSILLYLQVRRSSQPC